jgi:hypothetical protein
LYGGEKTLNGIDPEKIIIRVGKTQDGRGRVFGWNGVIDLSGCHWTTF